MNDVFEQIDGNRIKSLGYVCRLSESVPTGDQLKASCLELQADTEGQIVLFSQTSADYIGRSAHVKLDICLLAEIPLERVFRSNAL